MRVETAHKFSFDRVFTSFESDDSEPMETLEVALLKAELRAARDERDSALTIARAQGFDAGLDQARSERDVAILNAVDALHDAIETLDARFEDVERALTAKAVDLALTVAEVLAARAIAPAPCEAIDTALSRVLGQIARGTELLVRVHPDLVADMEARLAQRQSADRRRLRVTVQGDTTIAIGDGRVEWDQGGLALDQGLRRAEIVAELEGLLAAPTPSAPASNGAAWDGEAPAPGSRH